MLTDESLWCLLHLDGDTQQAGYGETAAGTSVAPGTAIYPQQLLGEGLRRECDKAAQGASRSACAALHLSAKHHSARKGCISEK